MRLHKRLDRAIYRASQRYFAHFYFVAGNGLRKKIEAVKRGVGLDEFSVASGNLTARAVEFVVSRSTFEGMARVASFGSASADPRSTLREARIDEVFKDGRTCSYSFLPARPLDENSPEAGTIRLYCTLKQETKQK